MKAKCYYCNKELTERTIKRHMKNCDTMKKKISEEFEENKSKRKQYIISIKYKYCKDYCIYISIDAALQLCHLDQFIRDVWVECCGHLSEFIIDGTRYLDNSDGNYQMNVRLKDVLYSGLKFEYEYDFGSTTYLTLEVIDEIEVSKKHSQIEIIARNNEEGRPNSPREANVDMYAMKKQKICIFQEITLNIRSARKSLIYMVMMICLSILIMKIMNSY